MKSTDKETFTELTASQITTTCLKILETRNVYAWRQNNLTVRHRKGIVTKGVPDILGYNRGTGLFTMVEIKKLGDVLSNDQIYFLTNAKMAGCIVLIGTQVKNRAELIPFDEYHRD